MTVRSGNDDRDWVFLVVQSVPVIVNGYSETYALLGDSPVLETGREDLPKYTSTAPLLPEAAEDSECLLAIEPLYILAQDVALLDCGTAIDDYG